MLILVANTGSSSLKLSIVDDRDATPRSCTLGSAAQPETLAELQRFVAAAPAVDAVGHRIVHGGPHLHQTALLTERVRNQMEAAAEIAPLHVPLALRVLDALRTQLHVPHVLCFDTSFHSRLPAAAATYAVPAVWRERFGIRRYGFHGLSCAWSLQRAAGLLQRDAQGLQLLVAHLGAGASITAIRDGHSVDTTMGFTPLEGLVMATRSGSVDPGAMLWLQAARGMTLREMNEDLEQGSGLLGLSGIADMRAVLERAARADARAALAVDVYVHRAASLMAAMAASLDRLDGIVFTGGVGENSPQTRRAICSRLTVLGVESLHDEAPSADGAAENADRLISQSDVKVPVLVVRAREDLEVAHEVRRLLSAR